MGRLVISHHKSYHVYKRENIEKVRKDEEKEAARVAEEERRMHEADKERRIAYLRQNAHDQRNTDGNAESQSEPLDLHSATDGVTSDVVTSEGPRMSDSSDRHQKRRRQDNDMAVIEKQLRRRERSPDSPNRTGRLKQIESNLTLVDHKGHINLFSDIKKQDTRNSNGMRHAAKAPKNPEIISEAEKAKKEFEDQITMRFINAAGSNGSGLKPWYAQKAGACVPGPSESGSFKRPVALSDNAVKRALDPLESMRTGARKVEQSRHLRDAYKSGSIGKTQTSVEAPLIPANSHAHARHRAQTESERAAALVKSHQLRERLGTPSTSYDTPSRGQTDTWLHAFQRPPSQVNRLRNRTWEI